jgi:hypothetical protein
MAIVFSIRGNSLDARFSSSGKQAAIIAPTGTNVPAIATSGYTGEIGGSSIDMDNGSGIVIGYLEFMGRNNTPAKGFSVNLRAAFGVSSGLIGLCRWGAGVQGTLNVITLYYNSGTLNLRYTDSAGNLDLNISGSWTPTTNTFYDIFFKWDGTTTSNAAKIYVNNSLIVQGTASGARPTDDRANVTDLCLGASAFDVQATRIIVNEFTIWDADIDPSAVTLDSGVAALAGNTRTSPITVAAFDGQSYSDPGIANVRLATNYIYAGSTLTGTLGASQDPGVGNVRLSTQYIIDGSTLTGTLAVPTAASGTAGTVDLNNILEQIRYVLNQNNTTTASPVDVSNNMTRRVQHVAKIHPLKIPVQPSLYPFITCYITGKEIEEKTISKNQLNAKRRANVNIEIVGAVWNNIMSTMTSDPADQDCNYLLENIEYCLRAYDNLSGATSWQFGDSVKYYDSIQEDAHLRAGVLLLKATVYY